MIDLFRREAALADQVDVLVNAKLEQMEPKASPIGSWRDGCISASRRSSAT